VGAGDVAEKALQKLIRLHVQKYERHLADVRREVVNTLTNQEAGVPINTGFITEDHHLPSSVLHLRPIL
jgi:hypothetical protein